MAPGLGQEGLQPWNPHVRSLSSQNVFINRNVFIKKHGGGGLLSGSSPLYHYSMIHNLNHLLS